MALLNTNLILQINPPQTPPSKFRCKQWTRNQKILVFRKIKNERIEIKRNFKIYGLHEFGKNQTQIVTQLSISRWQVCYSLRRGTVSPKNRKRIYLRLKADDVNQIIYDVESPPENRRKTFTELASGLFRHLGVSERVIPRKLIKRGYQRDIVRR